MAPVATQIATFLRNREAILRQVGAHLFPQAAQREQRDRAKQLFNSLDMHGTIAGFYARWGLDELANPIYSLRFERAATQQEAAVRGLLCPGDTFSIRQYANAQRDGSRWLKRRMPAMNDFVCGWLTLEGDRRRLREPERTLCSYVWQEAEGISRAAKLAWCNAGGHTPHNLQHDGVIIELGRGVGTDEAVAELATVCGHALGFPQPVEMKPMQG